jgi:hypothetical protein
VVAQVVINYVRSNSAITSPQAEYSYVGCSSPTSVSGAFPIASPTRRLEKFNSASCTGNTIKQTGVMQAPHQATDENPRPVNREIEGISNQLIQLSLDGISTTDHWVKCNWCHTIYNRRTVEGPGEVLACVACFPELIRGWRIQGYAGWTRDTLRQNLLVSLTQDDDWRTRLVGNLLDTGEPDLTDFESTTVWWWTRSPWNSSTRLFRAYDTRSRQTATDNSYMAPHQDSYDARTMALRHIENSNREPTPWISTSSDLERVLRWGRRRQQWGHEGVRLMVIDPRRMNPASIVQMTTVFRNLGIRCRFPNSNEWWVEYAIPRAAIVLDLPINPYTARHPAFTERFARTYW